MQTTPELLARLRERGIRNLDMARALALPDSRIPELYSGRRSLKHDEAVKLVAAFGLEDPPMMVSDTDLTALIKHVAEVLGRPIGDGDERLEGLKGDFQAFAEFQDDPAMRSLGASAAFFRCLSAAKTF